MHVDRDLPTRPSTRPSKRPVPIWVPDRDDPAGIEGNWLLADPASAKLHPRLVAQARAVAGLWASNRYRATA